jgi:hypothetical protein
MARWRAVAHGGSFHRKDAKGTANGAKEGLVSWRPLHSLRLCDESAARLLPVGEAGGAVAMRRDFSTQRRKGRQERKGKDEFFLGELGCSSWRLCDGNGSQGHGC